MAKNRLQVSNSGLFWKVYKRFIRRRGVLLYAPKRAACPLFIHLQFISLNELITSTPSFASLL